MANSASKTAIVASAAAVTGALVLYKCLPFVMKAATKSQLNPLDENLGSVVKEQDAPTYEEIKALGVIKGKSALVVGGTRGTGYGIALALAKSGASRVTIVGRNEVTGAKAISNIIESLPPADQTPKNIKFINGDIGTVASARKLLETLHKDAIDYEHIRYDFLIVTAAIFPQPKKRNPEPLNADGIEKSFAIGVVGRFLLYSQAHNFLKMPPSCPSSPMILNVMAAGCDLGAGFDRTLVRSLAGFHLRNIGNFAIGNEIMLRKLISSPDFSIPIVTIHPGYLKTDLHRGQGLFMDVIEGIMVHFMGCTEEECGRRQIYMLSALDSKRNADNEEDLLTIVDQFGYGRLVNDRMAKDVENHGDWLWRLLDLLNAGKGIEAHKD